MESLGIDIGSLFLKAVVVDEEGAVRATYYKPHHGHPARALKDAVKELGLVDGCFIGLAGSGAEKIAEQIGVVSMDLVRAQIRSVLLRHSDAVNVIDVGGSSLSLIKLDSRGKIRGFNRNSLCAAGTGSFLDEQAQRLQIDYAELSSFPEIENPPTIATRCAVFAKSDLIHHQQQGYGRPEMWAGLCAGMTNTMMQTLFQGRPIRHKTVLIGGVSQNPLILKNLQARFGDLVTGFPDAHLAGAEGAAFIAQENSLEAHVDWNAVEDKFAAAESAKMHKPLELKKSKHPDFSVYKFYIDEADNEVRISKRFGAGEIEVFMGIDIGSTSTKMVMIDKNEEVLVDIYRKTRGEPIEAARHLFRAVEKIMKDTGAVFKVIASGTTGSGRKLVGAVIGADIVVNEITAHVRGALKTSPDVETVFEIGGQDSKFMSLKDGRAHDSNMNYVCAAGTGSFIEEQARKLGFDVRDIGDMVQGIAPPSTSDRCTVFMEQDIFRLLREGHSRETVLAATMYSICQNYLNKVVGNRKTGKTKIAFMGATARNKGLVAAFENLLDVEIVISPYCHVMGAYGVALSAKDFRKDDKAGSFLGFDLYSRKIELGEEVCRLCQNNCKITNATIEGVAEKPSWGYLCGRDPEEKRARSSKAFDLFEIRDKMLKTIGAVENLDPNAPQIGVPMSLTAYTFRPLWERFFGRLGYRAKFTKTTNSEIAKRGVSLVAGDFCYPVKVSTGHVAQMLDDENTKWVFVPAMIAEKDLPGLPDRKFCPWVESHPAVLKSNLAAAGYDSSRIVSPAIDFRLPEKTMIDKLFEALGDRLGVSKSEIKAAWRDALHAQKQFADSCQREGKNALDEIKKNDEIAIVIVGRPYNVFDMGSNLSLPRKIAQYGYRVIPIDFMPFNPQLVPEEYRNVFWSYGQRIVSALDQVREDRNLFPIYLSNFSCGPDSFILTYAEQIMSTKPILILTLDEHGADTGYITRLEAYIDVIRNRRTPAAPNPIHFPKTTPSEFKRRKIWIPSMHPYGTPIFAGAFNAFGYDAEALPMEDHEAFEIGRAKTRGEECLPACVTLGALLKKFRDIDADPSQHAFFMPTAPGPCRFGQYSLLDRMALNAGGYKDVPILSPSSTNTYMGLENALRRRLWLALLTSDVFFKAGCRIRPYEVNKGDTNRAMSESLEILCAAFSQRKGDLIGAVKEGIERMRRVAVHGQPKPLVGIVGEIYVRCNAYSNEDVVGAIEKLGGEAWLSPMSEWILYTSVSQKRNVRDLKLGLGEKLSAYVKNRFLNGDEHRFYGIAGELLADRHEPPIEEIMAEGERYIPYEFEGESVLTIGRAIMFARQGAALVVNAGPFTCMHGSITDAIFQEISEKVGIPIVNMAYDGEGGQNSRLDVFFANRAAAKL